MTIGLYIIGDEILSGRRKDSHLVTVIELLKQHQLSLTWVQIIGDDFDQLVDRFKQTLRSEGSVLTTGGIGATPDDMTRAAIAAAAGVPLQYHPEGMDILRGKYGKELTPFRQRMVEFPKGATLIPNPINQIPGFSFHNHHCVPGFPEMAEPMIKWVLENVLIKPKIQKTIERSVRVKDTPESQLIPLMEKLLTHYSNIKVFSLPSIQAGNRFVELGVKGDEINVTNAIMDIQQHLDELGKKWDRVD